MVTKIEYSVTGNGNGSEDAVVDSYLRSPLESEARSSTEGYN
jgi:hypothetical protein